MPFNFFSLPHIRLLKSSSFLVTRTIMKTNPSLSKGNEVFTRVFPHKLKYQSSSSSKKLGLTNLAQQFSTRASEGRSAKSLIEDEADLSDWVSELKSDSFRKSRLYGESDDGENDWRGGGKGSAVKRKRDSDSDGYNGGGSRGSFNGDSRGKGRPGGEFGRRDEGFVSRGGRGSSNLRGRGRVGGEVERRNDRFSRDKTKEDNGFVSKRRDDSFGGNRRGGRGAGRGGKSISRGSAMMSEDDDEEEGQKNIMSKFKELISDEDDDDDEDDSDDLEDADDDGVLGKGHSIGKSTSSSPKISPDGSESYLSGTR